MKVYDKAHVRNVALFGHGSSGKTTLAESLAYLTGITTRQGKVTDGNTISDFDKEEQKRGFSIGTTMIPIEYRDCKINILDTPGYFDFVGETEEAACAADAAIIVVNGKAGVQVGVQKAWDLCEKNGIPRIFFVTNLDDPNSSYRGIVEALQERYGSKVTPFELAIREDEKLVGYVNLILQKGVKFTGKKGEKEDCAIPDYLQSNFEECENALQEAVAETSEELMDRFFDGEVFTPEEIAGALFQDVKDGSVVPVMLGVPTDCYGVSTLLDVIVDFLPAPDDEYDDAKPMSAHIFKTLVDPFLGKYSFVKVKTGVLKNDATLFNANKETEERISRLYILRGKEQIEVTELHAGDIGAISKLSNATTGDTLCTKASPVTYEGPAISTPYLYMAYSAKNKGDVDKLSTALNRIADEDRTIKLVNDSETHQTLIYGIGDQQLDTVVSKVLARNKVEMELTKPRIAYHETIKTKAEGIQGRHKKQSGGSGQFGEVFMDFEPSGDLDTPYVFEERVVGGSVPKNFFPAVEKGVAESVQKGPLAGYPVFGVKATLTDGKYHPVDSNEMAFKMAAIKSFKAGIMQANPVLLEPVASLRVVVPNDFTGDVMGDLNKRRGRVLGMNPLEGGKQELLADVPMSELFGYTTDLRSMTGGIGEFSYEFARYEQAPADVQQREMDAKEADEDE